MGIRGGGRALFSLNVSFRCPLQQMSQKRCVRHPKCDCLAAPWPAPAFFWRAEAPTLSYCFHSNNLWNFKNNQFPKRQLRQVRVTQVTPVTHLCDRTSPRQQNSVTNKVTCRLLCLFLLCTPMLFFLFGW